MLPCLDDIRALLPGLAAVALCKGGTCEDCKGKDTLPFLLVSFGFFCLLCVTYHVVDKENRATQPHSLSIIGIAAGMLITSIQHLGVFSNMDIPRSNPLKTLLNIMKLAVFDTDVLQLGCVGAVSPFYKFVLRLSAILVVVMCMLVIHVCYSLVKHRGRFFQRMPSPIGSIGTVFLVFLTPIVNATLVPIQCVKHPMLSTVRAYPTITCWEDAKHAATITLGLSFCSFQLGLWRVLATLCTSSQSV